jgi:(S)-sulfolactate dehydrogenase
MRIIICEFMDEAAVASLAARFDVLYDRDLVDRRHELLTHLAGADALIVRNRTEVDPDLLAAAGALKVVGRLGVGLDNIDVAACRARNVDVIPALGANALAVAEYVIGTAMFLLRGAYQATDAVAAGQWPRGLLSDGREIGGKTLGLIGFGGIGRLTGQLGRGLGMRVIGHDPQLPHAAPIWTAEQTQGSTLDRVLAEADVVSLHVPLTNDTRGLINATRLATMKAGAILINTARGGVVDEAAVAAALRAGTLRGAALDVFANEPLPAGSALAGCPNLLLTPHIAGVTAESNVRVSTLIADKVAQRLTELR